MAQTLYVDFTKNNIENKSTKNKSPFLYISSLLFNSYSYIFSPISTPKSNNDNGWESELNWESDDSLNKRFKSDNESDDESDDDKIIPNGELTRRQGNFIWKISWVSLGTTMYAIKQGYYDLALCPGSVFLTSLNYWRNPIPGIRKNIDISCVALACSYQLYRARNAEYAIPFYTTSLIGIGSFCVGIYNHIKKEYWKSIHWHCALHMFGNISSVILYSGYIPPVCLLCFYRNNIKKLLDSK